MVHLGKVPTDKDIETPVIDALKELDLSNPGDDEFTSSVYGSRYAAVDLPKHEMPDTEMPREVAYRMIK
jgi:glutamate decarboxylase